MDASQLELVVQYVSGVVRKNIEFNIAAFAVSTANSSSDLLVVSLVDGQLQKTKIFPSSIFHSFQILNGNIFIISNQSIHDENTFMNQFFTLPENRNIRASIVLPVAHDKIGKGAFIFGSYNQELLFHKNLFEKININSLISESLDQKSKFITKPDVSKAENDFFKQLFMMSMNACAVFETDGTVSLVNYEFENLTGYKKREIENKKTIEDFFSQSDKPSVRNLFDLPKKDQNLSLLKKNGEEKIINIVFTKLSERIQYLVQFNDITASKHNEIEIREWGERINAINEIIANINANVNLQQLLESLFIQLDKSFDYQSATIVLCDPLSSDIQLYNYDQDKPVKIKSAGKSVYQKIIDFLSQQEKIATDISSIEQIFKLINVTEKTKTRSQICIKLQTEENIIGVFCMGSDLPNAYSQFHIEVLQGISDQIAIAIMKAKLFKRYQQTLKNLSLLNKITESLNGCLDLEKVLRLIIKSTYKITDAKFCTVKLISQESLTNNGNKMKSDFQHRILKVAATKQPLIIDNIAASAFYKHVKTKKNYIRSMAVLPIIQNGKTIALVYIYFDKQHHFIKSEIDLLKSLMHQAAATIDNAKLYRQVKETKDYLENFIKYSGDAIVATTMDGKVNYFNARAEQIFGYTNAEILDQYLHSIMVDGSSLISDVKTRLLQSETAQCLEAEILRKDGSFLPVSWSFSLLKDNQQKIIGILGIGKDVSRQKKFENEIRQKSEELENLIYAVSHNLKTPLVSQEGFISLIQKEFFDQLNDEAKYYITRIEKNAKHMGKMINDLLQYFKVQQYEQEYERVNIEEIIHSVLNDLNLPQKIELSLSKNLPAVYFNKEDLKSVFANLISNAAKYSANGALPKIEIFGDQGKDCANFYVKDYGIGIEKKYHQRVFDLFFRLQTTKEIEGTGIGLALVKRIIEKHHGKIGIQSSPGEGTTVHFTIPHHV